MLTNFSFNKSFTWSDAQLVTLSVGQYVSFFVGETVS